MLMQHTAEALRDALEPLLPEFEVTAVPWHDDDGEWIVTVWKDGDVLADVFNVASTFDPTYVLRKAGRGPEIGRVYAVADIPDVVRKAS